MRSRATSPLVMTSTWAMLSLATIPPRAGATAERFTGAKEGRTQLVRVDAQSGQVTEITKGDQAVLDFSMMPDAHSIVALVSTPVMIGDLFSVGSDGSQRRITDVNQQLWSQLNLTAPEEFTYTSFDGKKIQSWIQKPPDFDPPGSSITNSNGWRPRATSCSTSTRADRPATGRTSETSSSIAIRGTIIAI
jgi:hypothetical protein